MKVKNVEKVGEKVFKFNDNHLVNFKYYTNVSLNYDVRNKLNRLYITFFEKSVCTFTLNQFQEFQKFFNLNEVLDLENGTIEAMFLEEECKE